LTGANQDLKGRYYQPRKKCIQTNSLAMLKSYFKIAARNLKEGKLYSFINIGGLAIGMAVAIVIGLWVWDELSFDKYHKNYDRIGQLWQFVKFDVEKSSYNSLPIPLAEELRSKYPEFEAVSVATYNRDAILTSGDKKLLKTGMYTEPDFPKMMTPEMIAGTYSGLADMNSIVLSHSLAKALFGKQDPMNKTIRLDNKADVKVTGVYKDFPGNSSFKDVFFLSSWKLFTTMDGHANRSSTIWDENSFQIFAQLKKGADFNNVSAKIKDIRMKRENPPTYKPEFFLHPMSKWHLHGDFKNGVNEGGLIKLVRLFGMAGIFVLLLACINFMNLSTARSEKRAKEVGIRKTLGSVRSQLVHQFFSESLLISFIALILSLIIAQVLLPFFNKVADKDMNILWTNPFFWLLAIVFCLVTGLIAGSYPALYLSSFQPLKVLKGRFKAGRFASLPRKVLVVFQFSISVALVIGTIVVFRQINYAKDRPIGYDSNGLIEVSMNTPDLKNHYKAIRSDLLNTGVVAKISQSSSSLASEYGGTTNITWRGKSPGMTPLLMSNAITHDFGKTVGWKILQGRDFSEKFQTDSSAMILNQTAAQLMGFKDPLNEVVRFGGKEYKIIGVTDNMIKESPFKSIRPSFFLLNYNAVVVINIKLASQVNASTALSKIGNVFKKYNPAAPFEYKFVDEQYAAKFSTEERIAKLAGFFAVLTIFISCLGLFGLASFVAEQRTKEIGIRKVLGATIINVWQLLSKEFLLLVFISLLVASPIAYYLMQGWLENYQYRIQLSLWIFGVAAFGALLITLITVSFQAIKAAIANPAKSLRTE
jgi:putative ABC transport system permease protein